MTLILATFSGLGLLDKAFEEQWPEACIVRAPDKLWGGDIKTFHPPVGKFDAVIGGPPCQAHSRLKHIVAHNRAAELAKDPTSTKYQEAEDLIPEFVRVVNEARPAWFLMENAPNVDESAWPRPEGYQVSSFILNNRWVLDTTPQNRERRFWFGHREALIDLRKYIDYSPLLPAEFEYAVCSAGSGSGHSVPLKHNAKGKPKRLFKNVSKNRSVEDYLRLQGMPLDFFGAKTPFTVAGQRMMLGNGVPLPMGRTLVKAVRAALSGRVVESLAS